MSDWDVLSPIAATETNEEEEEEEQYDNEYDYSDEGSYSYSTSPKPPRGITASSFQPMRFAEFSSSLNRPRHFNHSRRQDKLAYRHKTGDGIRKGHLNTGNDIEDALAIYNDGGEFYDAEKLREAKASDLIPDLEKSRTEIAGGCGSKNIIITKVKKGTMKKGRTNKEDIIGTKIDTDPKHYWDHISHQLMEDGQFVQGKYDAFHEGAIQERAKLGIGNSAEMNSLYCFWCFYLREHFDQSMYDEFLRLAREDVAGGSHYAIECYFRFCSYGLEKNWNEAVFHDFENEAMEDYHRKSNYGLEKLQAFRVNQKYTFEIPIQPDIARLLSTFPTMKSFRERQARAEKKERRMHNEEARKQRATQSFSNEKKAQPTPQSQPTEKKQEAPKKKQTDKFVPHSNEPNKPKQQPMPVPQKKQPQPQPQPQPQHNQGQRGGRRGVPRRTSGANMKWTFGMPQPASAPMDSPMHKRW